MKYEIQRWVNGFWVTEGYAKTEILASRIINGLKTVQNDWEYRVKP